MFYAHPVKGFLPGCTVVAAALALSSCGGGASNSPLDDALGYLPADAPLAVAVSTDLDSQPYRDLDAALQRFGVEGGIDAQLEQLSGYEGISFSSDVRPLLGNELVVGVPSAAGLGEEEGGQAVAALRVSDGDALRELLGDLGLKEVDEVEGASVYGRPPPKGAPEGFEPGGPGVAVDDDVLVVTETEAGLEQALAQRGEGDRLTEDVFSERLGTLPDEGIIRGSGDAQSVLEALGAEETASVPWIGALRSYGVVAQVEGRTLRVDASVTGDKVAEPDLPVDPGPSSPRVLKNRPSVATRDQAQTIEFALQVVRSAVPQAAFEQVTNDLEKRVGGSLSSLANQFGEGMVAELQGGQTVTRSVVDDPAAAGKALKALRDEVPRLAQLRATTGPLGDALEVARYAIPALPLPKENYFPRGSKVTSVPGEPDLYRLRPPAPRRARVPAPPGTSPHPPLYPVPARASRPQFVFGLVRGVFVTAPSLIAAHRAGRTTPTQVDLPPGALGVQLPVHASEFDVAGPKGLTLTTIEAGIEASTSGLRLHAEAGL